MKSIQDKINFIKWQLEARIFGGSIYQRVRNSLINKNILDSDPFYYIYWLDLNKSLLSKYYNSYSSAALFSISAA